MIGDHRPGITAATTRPRHGLERSLAVGMTGVPVTGAAQPLRMEIRRARAEGFDHLGSTEVALAGRTAPRVLASLKTLYGCQQGVFTPTGRELRDQWSEPVRCFSKHFLRRFPR